MSQLELVEYGIQTENSDIRAHVSVVNRTVYVYQTKDGITAIEKWGPPLRPAFQEGVQGRTAEGWLVRVEWIQGLRRLKCPRWARWDEFSEKMTTTEKGKLAVALVLEAMRLGRFPFWVDTSEDDRENVQVQGADIVVFCRKKVQVKCDWKGGDRPLGTGNLFLQKAERNPLKMR